MSGSSVVSPVLSRAQMHLKNDIARIAGKDLPFPELEKKAARDGARRTKPEKTPIPAWATTAMDGAVEVRDARNVPEGTRVFRGRDSKGRPMYFGLMNESTPVFVPAQADQGVWGGGANTFAHKKLSTVAKAIDAATVYAIVGG